MKIISREKWERIRKNRKVFGVWNTLRQGLANLLTRTREDRFDSKHGTDTSAVHSERADAPPLRGQQARSIPTDPRLLKYILRNLEIDYGEFTFVDFGCGKGRALLCASDFPFSRIIGVEWSEDVYAVARRNLEIYSSSRQQCFDLDVHCMNVLDYELPSTSTLLYMYNPFGAQITARVFAKVRRSVQANPRRFLVIYSGLGGHAHAVMAEYLGRFGIDVIEKCRTLNSEGSWVLGEVRQPDRPVGD